MPDSTLTKLRCALRGWTTIETSRAVFLLDCGISMHLATKILRRDLDSGSFQFSQSPAKVNGRPSFMAIANGSFGLAV